MKSDPGWQYDLWQTILSVAEKLGSSNFTYIDYLPLPPSDNEKVHWRKAYEKLKVFREDVQVILLTKKVPIPTAPVILLYKCYLNRSDRDPQNCQKALLDALYKQDKNVYPWTLVPEVDKKNPRVEVWIVKI